ncbi:DeoR family transcriptional regulator, partial [Enterocloster bolteae]|uniref:DeoR family transcriptional regulator n=1 Tax=Enterocloster bolteae TaxID=208479 RepID=UPI002A7EF8F4
MNRTERLAEIKKVVEESGRIEVNDLSDMFHVSEVTIRKDLSLLEDRQWIRRIHGAA